MANRESTPGTGATNCLALPRPEQKNMDYRTSLRSTLGGGNFAFGIGGLDESFKSGEADDMFEDTFIDAEFMGGRGTIT